MIYRGGNGVVFEIGRLWVFIPDYGGLRHMRAGWTRG